MEKSFKLYKELKEEAFEVGVKLIIYNSLYVWNHSIPNEEMEQIADILCDAYTYSGYLEYFDLTTLADRVSESLFHGFVTLEELKEMSRWDILDAWRW